jgi:hypothetical protein
MPIQFACPACNGAVRAPDAFAGKHGTCHHCKVVVRIPTIDALAQLPPDQRSKLFDLFLEGSQLRPTEPMDAVTPARGTPSVAEQIKSGVRTAAAGIALVLAATGGAALGAVFAYKSMEREPVEVKPSSPAPVISRR